MPHFSSDKSQKVFKIQKNSPLPIIAIFLLLIALCGIVSADINQSYTDIVGPISSATVSANPSYSTGTPINGTVNLSSYNGNNMLLSQITALDSKSVRLTTLSPVGCNADFLYWPSPTGAVTLSDSSNNIIGTGNIYFTEISNSSTTLAQYDVLLQNLVWFPSANNVLLTSGYQNSIITMQYTLSPALPSDVIFRFGTSSNPITGAQSTLFFNLGTSAGTESVLSSPDAISQTTQHFNYNFQNIVTVTYVNSSSQYNWNINKSSSLGVSGISISNVTDGSGVLSGTVTDGITKNGASYTPPIFINITDPIIGTQFLHTAFYPTFTLYAPITNSTINMPLPITFSSNSVIPSDVNQVVFNTNFPNSNNILSNILYDNNQTQRNPLNFYKKSGNWYQSDGIGFNINLGSTLPNSFTTTFINANNYYVTATLNSNLIGGFAANNPLSFYITGTNAGTSAYFTISDSKTGNPISGSILGIFDVPNQKWTNTTLTSGSINLPLNTNYFYAYQGTAPNYQPSAFNTLLIPSGGGNATISIALIPSSLAVTAGNTTISIAVVNGLTNAPVSGATVTVSAANATNYTTQSQTTVNGNTLFIVPTGNTYTASASATGYQSGSLIAVVGSSPVTQTISLTPLSSVPTIATSTTTYPGQQPSIYPTLNGTVTDQTNPFFGNAIDWLGFMGAKPSEIALVLAFLLILLGGVCGSAASSVGLGYAYQPDPLGALAGALLGFIASVAFGFFPAWLAVAAVIIIAFIVARRAWA